MPILSYKLDEVPLDNYQNFSEFISRQPQISINDFIDAFLSKPKEQSIDEFYNELVNKHIKQKGGK